MTTRISSRAVIELLWPGVQGLSISDDVYNNAMGYLEAKKSESTPQSKNPSLQAKLNITHATYQRAIPLMIDNIKAQYMIGLEVKMLFQRRIDLQTTSDSLMDIQNRLNPLRSQFKLYATIIQRFENRIVELLNTN